DTTAWFALLRTPFVGLALGDIERLALHASLHDVSLWTALQQHEGIELGSDGRQRMQRCVPVLLRGRQQMAVLPLRTVLEYAWIDLGGPACIDDSAILPNIVPFFDLVDEHTRQNDVPDIHRFERRLQRCFGSAVDPAVNLHIMTI